MQETNQIIYEIALTEIPTKLHKFHDEDAIFYNGFKISLKKGGTYAWEDVRYSNYYEPVDPKITEQVLLQGFTKTLNEVMYHNDLDKVLNIKREVEKIDALIRGWTIKSTDLWNNYNRQTKTTKANEVDEGKKKTRLSTLKKRYEKSKALYQKKRRVLVEEKEEVRKDLVFYETRIQMYNYK
jgi:hypothetical protein